MNPKILIFGLLIVVWFMSPNWLMYPVNLLVATLHEYGHAISAILTGGSVVSVIVNSDGSGLTTTMGGVISIITMGGYIGSCVFGNAIVWSASNGLHRIASLSLAILILLFTLVYSGSSESFWITILFSVMFGIVSLLPIVSKYILQFIGIACTAYVIKDFDVGPSSDLEAYASEMGIFSSSTWMYIWLIIAITITILNIRIILKSND